MKVKELKQWQLFYNTNNYLCLVYKITQTEVLVVNDHGTFYRLSKDSNHVYKTKFVAQNVDNYFNNFPYSNLHDYQDAERFEEIKRSYLRKDKNLMLLL